jgi:predicted metal-dependent peptidase
MFTTTLTAVQRLHKNTVSIMGKDRYLALNGVLMIGEKRIETDDERCPTAYTNGRDEVYGQAFVDKLNDAEFRFLILHECYHKMYRHLTTWKHLWDIDRALTNQAADYVINIKLVDDNADGFATMTGALSDGCFDTQYRGWDTARVFWHLKKQQDDNGGGTGNGEPLDVHDWEGAMSMDPAEARELAQHIDEAMRQGVLMAGKLGNGADRSMTGMLETKIDWREVLRDFITTTCAGNDYGTWQRPNRRFIGAGAYLPSGISEQIGEIIEAFDMSGSIGAREQSIMRGAVGEIAEQVKPSAVRVLYWDTEVTGEEVYRGHEIAEMANTTKPVGGGGTDVTCVPEYIKDNNVVPQCAIVVTDGYLYGGWGAWTCPVLWVILDNKNAVPTHGIALHVNSRDL